MGKGGYHGGSTIVGPRSGWFSYGVTEVSSGKKPEKRKPKLTPEQVEQLAVRKALRAKARLARKQHAAGRKHTKIGAAKKQDPAEIAARLSRRMKGVTVIRRTSHTLRARKPSDTSG